MRIFSILFFSAFLFFSCSKKEAKISNTPSTEEEAIQVYQQALKSLEDGQYFNARIKFDQSESLLPQTQWAAKSALMSGYCLYSINSHDESIISLKRFIKTYPADPNIDYANYLIAINYYEQILGTEKDLEPLLLSKISIENFLKKFPNTDYAMDLRFKLDLIINQMAAKELSIARYYIDNAKWIPAINRLKIIVENYDKTIFVEEALFRLVEIYHRIGLEKEAKSTAVLLGYNYNSSEWYERSYKILNSDYKPPKITKDNEDESLVKRTLKKIIGLDE